MSRLSSLLVRDRVVDVGTMERAFRRKDLEGGRLGTILLELGALDEATFQYYLSQAAGLPVPTTEMLASVEDEVLHELDVADALAYGVVPAAVVGKVLQVLVRDPLDAETLALLEDRVGRPLQQFILAEFRFEHALAELYGVRPSPRASTLIVRYPTRIGRAGMTGQHRAIGEAGATSQRMALLSQLGMDWSEEQLYRFLAHSESRDDIVQALLGYAHNHFVRCFVLAVTQGKLRGFASKGAGLDPDALRGVQLEDNRLLRSALARGNETLFEGLAPDLGVSGLYDALHLERPLEVACFVLRVGSRPAMVLVGDSEQRPVARAALPSVELAVTQAAASLIRLVRAQKRAQRLTGSHTAQWGAARSDEAPARIERPLASLDDGWEFPAELDPLSARAETPARADERTLTDTDPERPAAIREASDGHTSVDSLTLESDIIDDDEGLDDLMFGEIERLVMEEHADDLEDEAALDELALPTLLGIGGVEGTAEVESSPTNESTRAPRAAVPTAGGRSGGADLAGPVALVEALHSPNEKLALRARAGLLLGDESVLEVFTQRFPGPVERRPETLGADEPIDVLGPFFAVARELGLRYVETLLILTRDDDAERRLAATICLRDVRHADNLAPLTERLFDADPAVRRAARAVLASYAEAVGFGSVLQRVRRALEDGEASRRIAAAEALAALGDAEAVPLLLKRLDDDDSRVFEAARAALERLAFQAFADAKRWGKWYKRHGRDTRATWLLEGMTHKQPRIRELAYGAVTRLGDPELDYDPHGGRRELKRAVARLAAYLESSGPVSL